MSWLAVFVLGVGLADLLGALRPRTPWLPVALAGATMVAVALLAGLTSGPDAVAVGGAVVAMAAWRALGRRAERSAVDARRALVALVLPAFLLLACSGFASGVGGHLAAWMGWIDVPALNSFDPGRLLLLVALAAANLATGNQVVRFVLVSVHAQPPRLGPGGVAPASERLRGGRLLGPLERLLIVGFGVAGYVAAAGLVVGAKGLLRFPELQAAARDASDRVDEVTEYFLVGTFTSLLVALASVVLLG